MNNIGTLQNLVATPKPRGDQDAWSEDNTILSIRRQSASYERALDEAHLLFPNVKNLR